MNVLIACEESQAVTAEFRKLGIQAFSCDLLPTSGNNPEWHLQRDVKELLELSWDLIVAFPPCTYLAVSGAQWYYHPEDKHLPVLERRPHPKYPNRTNDREDAVDFFMLFANADCPRIAIENPVGIMSSKYRKPDQIIHPYHFGDPFEKTTCLWLKGLPKLVYTDVVQPPPRLKYDSGKSLPAWYADVWGKNKNERALLRSKTFPGLAKAMAEQWTCELRK